MKPWAYLLIVAAVLAAFGSTYAVGHSAGYDKRVGEIQEEILDAVAAARLEEEKLWKEIVAAAEAEIVIEERIVETIREVEIEIPTVVERIVELTPECADLGSSFAGLLNDQVRAGNGVQSPEPAAPLDDGL